jgi:hypothetical protein
MRIGVLKFLHGVGELEKQPRTEDEWKAERRRAVTLIEVTNLLVMEGRHAAPPETEPGQYELSPQEIDQKLAKDRQTFTQFAIALRTTALSTLKAIDKKDAAALLASGSDLDAACEACHLAFWYPVRETPSK